MRITVACLLLVLIIAAAVWWNRAAMMQVALQRFLAKTSLLNPKISGVQFGFTQVELATMEFGIETGVGRLLFKTEDISVNYDLSIPKVDSIAIGHAQLKLDKQSEGKSTNNNGAALTTKAIPLDRLTVEKLDFEFNTPYGLTRYAGRAEIYRGTADTLAAKLQDAQHTIRIEFAPNFQAAKIIVEQTAGGKILELNAQQLDQPNQQADLHGNVGAFDDWLKTSSLVPETFKFTLATSVSPWLTPSIKSMQVDITTKTPDNFNTLQGKALLTRENRYPASATLSMAKAGKLDVDVQLDMTSSEALELAQPWLPQALRDWQITSANVRGAIALRWQSQRFTSGMLHLTASDVAITAGSTTLKHGNIDLDMPDLTNRLIKFSADVPVLEIGKIVAHDLIVRAVYLAPELMLEQTALSIYDGSLAILPITVNLDQRPLILTLQLQNVDLAKLLATLDYQELSATGTINGELPIKISPDAIELQDGMLTGTRPGVLRYQGPVADNENIAFKALRNLNYHSLQAKVNYQTNGDYHLGLRLEGSNPEVLSGHPLAFNLNLNGQLPELLKRGFLAGDLERIILEEAKTQPLPVKKTAQPLPKTPIGDHQPKSPSANRRSQ